MFWKHNLSSKKRKPMAFMTTTVAYHSIQGNNQIHYYSKHYNATVTKRIDCWPILGSKIGLELSSKSSRHHRKISTVAQRTLRIFVIIFLLTKLLLESIFSNLKGFLFSSHNEPYLKEKLGTNIIFGQCGMKIKFLIEGKWKDDKELDEDQCVSILVHTMSE